MDRYTNYAAKEIAETFNISISMFYMIKKIVTAEAEGERRRLEDGESATNSQDRPMNEP